LGVLLAQHRILLGREQLPPLLRRVGDLEGAGDSLAAAAEQAPAKQAGAGRGDGNDAKIDLAPGESHQISPQCRDAWGARVAGLARAFRPHRGSAVAASPAIQLARTGFHMRLTRSDLSRTRASRERRPAFPES